MIISKFILVNLLLFTFGVQKLPDVNFAALHPKHSKISAHLDIVNFLFDGAKAVKTTCGHGGKYPPCR